MGGSMLLRNKKTGMIVECEGIVFTHCNALALDWEQYSPNVNSFAELNADWEDVEDINVTNIPLIKNERVCKAVRAWAEANGLDTMPIYYDANYNRFCDDKDFNISIDFYREVEGGLHGGYSYYLDELCGEKESPEPLEPTFVDLDERIKEKAAAEKLCKGKNDMHLTEEEK